MSASRASGPSYQLSNQVFGSSSDCSSGRLVGCGWQFRLAAPPAAAWVLSSARIFGSFGRQSVLPSGPEALKRTAHQQASIDEIQLGQTVLRRGECRTNYAIINDLARRLAVPNPRVRQAAEWLKVIAEALGVRKSDVKIIRGGSSRLKVVEVRGLSSL